MFRYPATIFLSAFLLFEIQPMLGKYILPWFGGTPAVWTTCMLFFQCMLVGGYAYAHASIRFLAPRTQSYLHLALLALALILLPITPDAGWKPTGQETPQIWILMLLGISVGVPYFLLASTGPLLQAWHFRTFPTVSPYRLYALSNIGSILGLLTYPFLIEPNFRVTDQTVGWSWAFGVFAILSAWVAIRLLLDQRGVEAAAATGSSGSAIDPSLGTDLSPIPLRDRWPYWLLLSTTGSALFLATTSQICLDVAAVPFLWILPLALYLLTFILCFDNDAWYARDAYVRALQLIIPAIGWALWKHATESEFAFDWAIHVWQALSVAVIGYFAFCAFRDPKTYPPRAYGLALGLALALVGWTGSFPTNTYGGDLQNITFQIAIFLVGMFFCCMICHGEMVRLRPPSERLTGFYLTMSAGGALGGILLGVVVPLVFTDLWELYLSIGAVVLLLGALEIEEHTRWSIRPAWGIVVILVVLGFVFELATRNSDVLYRKRNFFGKLAVKETDNSYQGKPIRIRSLIHGQINHGSQIQDPDLKNLKFTYFGPHSGIGIALAHHPNRNLGNGTLNISITGLGAGGICAHLKPGRSEEGQPTQPGDRVRYYEINPAVIEVAGFENNLFTYLQDARDRGIEVDVVLGDARLEMEREVANGPRHDIDVLALDAFSSDAVPLHLLTRECFDICLAHLKPDGILAINITNRYLDLFPILAGLAERTGMTAMEFHTFSDKENLVDATNWVLVTRNPEFLANEEVLRHRQPERKNVRGLDWTDESNNLFELLMRRDR